MTNVHHMTTKFVIDKGNIASQLGVVFIVPLLTADNQPESLQIYVST